MSHRSRQNGPVTDATQVKTILAFRLNASSTSKLPRTPLHTKYTHHTVLFDLSKDDLHASNLLHAVIDDPSVAIIMGEQKSTRAELLEDGT
jgi:hypothetical protein